MSTKTTSGDATQENKRVPVSIHMNKTENIIFIGSELYYNSFWLKMMFISAAYYALRSSKFRLADRVVIAYIAEGYNYYEKLTLENLKTKFGYELIAITNNSDIIKLLNRNRGEYKIKDLFFFSHGFHSHISLNYRGYVNVQFSTKDLASISKDIFTSDGVIYSYACRTGISMDGEKFDNDRSAKPENSLAQNMATHFKVQVHAFLRRTSYAGILHNSIESKTISDNVNDKRDKRSTLVVNINGTYEALPHMGLSPSVRAKWWEGVNDYALWRKPGGIKFPSGGDGPKGLSADMKVYEPK